MSFKSNELKPIPPAPFTSPQVPEFTEEDYLLYLEHPLWTKDDTMSLLDAVRIFDHDWNLVASTFHGDPTKTALACQKRYLQLEEFEAAKARQADEEKNRSLLLSPEKHYEKMVSMQRTLPRALQPGKQQMTPIRPTYPPRGLGGLGLPQINQLYPVGRSSPHPVLIKGIPGFPFSSPHLQFDPALLRTLQSQAFSLLPVQQVSPIFSASKMNSSLNTIPSHHQLSSVPVPAPPPQRTPQRTSQRSPPTHTYKPHSPKESPSTPTSTSSTSEKKRSLDVIIESSPESDGSRKKRLRRTASEISRNFRCDMPNCSKAYGSEGALKMHIRLKHQGVRISKPTSLHNRSNSIFVGPFIQQPVMVGPTSQTFCSRGRSTVSQPNTPRVEQKAGLKEGVLTSKKDQGKMIYVPFLRLEIGGYECKGRSAGDLVARFLFTEKKLQWEVSSGRARLIITSSFSQVAGFGLNMLDDGSALLTIEFNSPPTVSLRGDIKIENDIARCKRHALHFAKGTLNRPVEALLSSDDRLRELANLGLPTLVNPFFESTGDLGEEDGTHNKKASASQLC